MSKTWVWPLRPLRYPDMPNLLVGWPVAPGVPVRDPASAPFLRRPGLEPGGPYWYYPPTPANLEVLRQKFPKDNPENPSWTKVESVLVKAGHDIAKLWDETAHGVVNLLAQVIRKREGDDPAWERERTSVDGHDLKSLPSDRQGAAQESRSSLDYKAWASSAEIAAKAGVDPERLRKRLERLRAKDHTCFREMAKGEATPRQARFVYNAKAVQPIIDKLKTSDETSA